MYEVRSAGAKGLGVFATSKILRGTRIFSERPTLTITAKQDIDSGDIYTVFRSLSAVDQASILQLSAHVTSPFLRWTHVLWYTTKELFTSFSIPRVASIRQHKSVLSIFRTNSFAIGGKSTIQQAIFARIARLNHSCVPNCQGNFDESRLCFNIHSTRDIEPQEELNISYLPEHGATHASRQANLTPAYGFECECPACDLSSTRGKDGEARRKQMQTDLAAFVERVGKGTETSPDMELGTIQKYIQLFEDEGIAGRELSTICQNM
ncbi:SET domain-containing protein [Tothia fuscella]|uniref:SET domain-containing protein n=1 Tax=Tothia fuscella TaxID=1048955 RepID=A0A9P4TZK3_9PEZI|nr:SET domain-containing protein [Tothia fuscella]